MTKKELDKLCAEIYSKFESMQENIDSLNDDAKRVMRLIESLPSEEDKIEKDDESE